MKKFAILGVLLAICFSTTASFAENDAPAANNVGVCLAPFC